MSNGHENRQSFRVTESVFLKFEVITEDEFHEGLEHRKIRLGLTEGVSSRLLDIETRLNEAIFVLGHESDRIARCFALINEKIDAVIDHLPELRRSKASLAGQPPQTCQIGADGMAFATDTAMEVGSKLVLRFILTSDNRYIETLCHVVRLVEDFEYCDTQRPHAVAVQFHAINPSQKEILIQHLFNRESETLRMRRLKLEADSDT